VAAASSTITPSGGVSAWMEAHSSFLAVAHNAGMYQGGRRTVDQPRLPINEKVDMSLFPLTVILPLGSSSYRSFKRS
jgi:hypothetical protein